MNGEIDPMKLLGAMKGQGGEGGAQMAQIMSMLGGSLEAGAGAETAQVEAYAIGSG